MKQVFFITDEKLTAMLWQGNQLVSKYNFEKNDTDINSLNEYLSDSASIPSLVIVDVLEEEISLTHIPHVAPHERKFLIDRVLTRMFRASTFSTAQIIGREATARKDDQLLVAGLTSDKALLQWLDILNNKALVIQGIYSLPLVADKIIKVLNLHRGITLLVSRQSKSFIRQSVFKNGKLLYSRNIPLAEEVNVNVISEDLKKTRKYLENQRLLVTSDRIEVAILTSEELFISLEGLDELVAGMNVSYVPYKALKEKISVNMQWEFGGRELFSYLLLSTPVKNHYGRDTDIQRYRSKKNKKYFTVASVVVSVVLMLLSVKFYIDSDVLDSKYEGLTEQVSKLKKQNSIIADKLNELPVKAKTMKVFVDNLNNIEAEKKYTVEQVMIDLSQVFMSYPHISLKKFNWYLSEKELNKNSESDVGAVNNRSFIMPANNEQFQLVTIDATIDFSGSNKQRSMDLLNKFIATIENLAVVNSIKVTKEALKSSSSDRMSGVISKTARQISDFSFSIKITRDR